MRVNALDHVNIITADLERSARFWNKRIGGRYHDHEQGHGRTYGKHDRRGQRGLHGARGGDLGNPKLIACMGGQGILRHQLPGNLPRKRLIDTSLDVDFGKLLELILGILAQLLALTRKISLFRVGL